MSKIDNLRLAAIDPYVETNILAPTERPLAYDKSIVQWGDGNAYPDYLLSLYREVTSLHTVVRGSVDYIVGNDAYMSNGLQAVNRRGQSVRDLLREVAESTMIYGGRAYEIIRTRDGRGIAEVYAVDLRNLRCDKDHNVYYYSEAWTKAYGAKNVVRIPRYMPGSDAPRSILYVSNDSTQVYPSPLYAPAVTACEIERSVDRYHLNAVKNGFTASMIVNFNNGTPTDEIREEIERTFNDKFAGSDNAGRILLSFNDSLANKTTFERVDVADFGAKYETLAKWSRQQIFSAFRANPNLFGLVTESLGFSSEEYDSAYRLYNRTTIRPIQSAIADEMAAIYGVPGILTIEPFSIDEAGASGEEDVR